MSEIILEAVKKYQCPGCVYGSDTSCYEKNEEGMGCGKHGAGTMLRTETGLISLFLGMPKGFCRVGPTTKRIEERLKIIIFETWKEKHRQWGEYDKFNVLVWAYEKDGVTFIRGLSPRINRPFLHVVLETLEKNIYDVFDKRPILSDADIDEMD